MVFILSASICLDFKFLSYITASISSYFFYSLSFIFLTSSNIFF